MILALVVMIAMPMFAERVQPETARKVATTFLNNNGAKANQLTDLTKEAGFSNLYIFNAQQGFVVMAADDCVQPILGYSLTGHFRTENMPSNVSGWLQGYNDEIQFAIDNKLKATPETAQLWKDLSEGNSKAAKATVIVDALIQTTWDQDPIYNKFCPYNSDEDELTVTGCVATAMAQIMRYWEYPAQGTGSHTYNHTAYTDSYGYHAGYGQLSANFSNTTYDWANMPLSLSASSTTEQIDAVATLMYHCGVSVEMDYGIGSVGGSGAYSSDIPYALTTYFRYKSGVSYKEKRSYNTNNWNNLIKTELDAGRPVEYNGSGSGGGHAFVCDGYDNSNYFHFNWGWSGSNDGFYSLSNLVPGSGGSGGGSYSFTSDQSAVIGIQPKACTASAPTNLAITLEGRTSVLTWNMANNAVSYSIYRDGSLIANTTNTTYSDIDLSYGTYAYYVKSVDSNGAKSSQTTTVTVSVQPLATNLTIIQNSNNAILNWTEPEWCIPQTDNEVLTYGDGSIAYRYGADDGSKYYVGQRYPTSLLASNKVLYKVTFYAVEAGNFTLLVYTSNPNANYPDSPAVLEQPVNTSLSGWVDIEVTTPLQLDETKDLWVFIYDPEGKEAPFAIGTYSGSNGLYFSYDPYDPTTAMGSNSSYAVLIRTCIADGAFTYNLYDNTTTVAQNLSGTSYTVSNIANNTAHLYTLKTNTANGMTGASNMAGLTLGNASLSSLTMNANDKMIVTEDSKLTVSGTLSDVNADNLILENGAQLVNSSTGVQATVKKNITAYTQDGGWCLLASPFTDDNTPTVDNGLLANEYDLYTFDQSQNKEWRNYEAQNFDIVNKTGYLYANSGNPTLTFMGTLAANVTATSLAYDANAIFKGFNLIGNPYPCNAYVNRSFYVMNGDGSEFTLGSNPIPPCSAILVQAQGTEESVTFSKNASKNEPNIAIAVTKANTRDNAIIDQARVCFNEKDQLMKYTLNDRNGRLYIPQNGQDFAAAYANGGNEMPINFKAAKNGTYTISIEAEGLELDYLHLIDNMTGADIDLLALLQAQGPANYTFEAKTTDYALRFRLVFNDNTTDGSSTGSGTFAYISDGNIIIINNAGEATLQIVDMMGRVVVEGDAINHVSTNGMTSGVYVLRLINGENVRTQKIVID